MAFLRYAFIHFLRFGFKAFTVSGNSDHKDNCKVRPLAVMLKAETSLLYYVLLHLEQTTQSMRYFVLHASSGVFGSANYSQSRDTAIEAALSFVWSDDAADESLYWLASNVSLFVSICLAYCPRFNARHQNQSVLLQIARCDTLHKQIFFNFYGAASGIAVVLRRFAYDYKDRRDNSKRRYCWMHQMRLSYILHQGEREKTNCIPLTQANQMFKRKRASWDFKRSHYGVDSPCVRGLSQLRHR
ncbi:hypothetical protein BCR41DRAFT_373517 [Lobosporangium transversale]|uniref:Uncharacterized protein n=1 Tax=Lobosporangium transversale TaxID=64571 RepID=A0A1Y2GHL4_9FUNG|nr:hypothetical protein BCR41DRAFT_373517 [Lobosporangium transversale]ORZ07764.1 hypothetical protein BCR41DRAFT_373517 [Lobosporangium transversale]|eukprot:XP_021878130.1 hypothetical protein BCR41DRAFT_373517 [Lobosporangium transversale]